MRTTLILGIVLIVLGAAILGYGHLTTRTEERTLQIGKLKVVEEHKESVFVPPVVGWALIAGGAGVLAFGVRSRKIGPS